MRKMAEESVAISKLHQTKVNLMKRSFLLTILLGCIGSLLLAQSHNFHWVDGIRTNVEIVAVAADGQGNSFAAGHFSGQLIIGGDTLQGGANLNVFLVKYDVNGTPLWARKFGGSSTDIVFDLGVDPLGFAYITGSQRSSMTVAGTVFPPSSNGDFYLVKFSPNGSIQWAFHAGNGSGESGESIDFDATGNVYVAGTMGTTIAFGGLSLVQSGIQSAFLAKFDPSGTPLMANSYGNTWSYNGARGVAVLPNGEHYLVGQYDTIVAFGTDTLRGVDDCWVAKFDAAGNYQWSRGMQGPDYHVWYDVDAAPNGDVYLVGDFYDTLYFGGNTYPVVGLNDIIIAHYDASGNLLDHRVIGTPGNEDGQSISVMPNGDYFVSGEYSSGASLGGPSLPAYGLFDFFVAKYSANGTYQWAEVGGSQSFDKALSVATDGLGRIYVGGSSSSGMNLIHIGGQTFTQTGGYIFKILENANHVSGRVAMDYNHNSVYEASDLPWNGGQVNLSPYVQSRVTGLDGEFHFHADTGNYTLNLPVPPNYYNLNPVSHSASFPTLGLIDTTNYFLLEPIPGITDVRVTLTPMNNPVPGQDYWLRLDYQNVGTDTATGVVTLKHPHRLAYTYSNPFPSNIVVDTLHWNYANLLPWESRSILVTLQPDTFFFLGQQVLNYASITPFATDADQSNNNDTLSDFISTSFDPNDKLVSPAGPLEPAEVQNGVWLTYTIRFQNTGNDTAYLVRLQDSLQANLLPHTMELLGASHPYTFSLNGNIANWRFENILLPDSASNPGGSMGFAKFRIMTVQNLTWGDHVDNFADIYFDYNAAVRTPTATVIIDSPIAVAPDATALPGFTIFPNPNNGQFSFLSDKAINTPVSAELYDLQGRRLWEMRMRGMSVNQAVACPTVGLPHGIYLLRVMAEGTQVMEKVVVR
jgi:uncharacterized repeat protein (TIGR01451 family)